MAWLQPTGTLACANTPLPVRTLEFFTRLGHCLFAFVGRQASSVFSAPETKGNLPKRLQLNCSLHITWIFDILHQIGLLETRLPPTNPVPGASSVLSCAACASRFSSSSVRSWTLDRRSRVYDHAIHALPRNCFLQSFKGIPPGARLPTYPKLPEWVGPKTSCS